MQIRYPTGLTGEQYVAAQLWRSAKLEQCPNHPHSACSFARHGTYMRKMPRGTRVARWYCPQSRTTFSLLPDCLAARLPGTLDALEAVVVHAERAASVAIAANVLRGDAVDLPGAIRWVRRRLRLVHHVLTVVADLLPEQLPLGVLDIGAVRARLGTDRALTELRRLIAPQLSVLPAPLGFRLQGIDAAGRNRVFQHEMGPDPPPLDA